jgi:hypothetical protein
MLPPFSACYLLHPSLLLVLFFEPEDGDEIFLRKFGLLSTHYTVLYVYTKR